MNRMVFLVVLFGSFVTVTNVTGCAGRNGSPSGVDVHDCGQLILDPLRPESWRVSHTFTVVNKSRSAIAKIDVDRVTCGCTSSVIANNRLAPGDKTDVTISYELPYKRQRRREGVYLRTGLPEAPTLAFFVEVDVFPSILIEDRPLRLDLLPDASAVQEVNVFTYQPAEQHKHSLCASCSNDDVITTIEPIGPDVLAAGVRRSAYRLILHSAPATPHLGDHCDLTLRLGTQLITRPVSLVKRREITTTPSQVFLQPRTHSDATTEVRIQSDQEFSVEDVYSTDPRVKCASPSIGKMRTHTLVLTASREDISAKAAKIKVTVTTDHPRERSLEIPVFVLW